MPQSIADGSAGRGPRRSDALHIPFIAWAILAVSLALTAFAWVVADRHVQERARDNFRAQAEVARAAIAARMLKYEQALRGGVALFAASDKVTRAEWRSYYQALELERHYPGIQGFGYVRWLAPQQRQALVDAVRAEGYPGFDVRPAGERSEYAAIVYIEPLVDRNLRAFGYDMWSEDVRRQAMARARDSGAPALSGPVRLLQETETAPQPGVLMYLPVYRNGSDPGTAAQRRHALVGFVYAPFRMHDLMHGILGERELELAFRVFDGALPATSLFDSAPAKPAPEGPAPRFTHRATIDVAGRPWTLQFHSRPAFDAASASWQPMLIALGGLLVDLVLFVMIWRLWVQRARSDVAAQAALAGAQQADERSRQIVESAPNGVLMVDAGEQVVFVNAHAERLFGRPRGELLGQPVRSLLPQWRAGDTRGECVLRRKDTSELPVEIGLSPIDTGDGPMLLASLTDIRERKAAQQRIEAALQEKTVLLNEVHHRVKNNLQVVSSLLSLQSGRTRHDEAREALAESQGRVQAMALIHQLLYEGKGFSVVDLGQYLRGLVRLVQDSYREAGRRIELQLNAAQTVVLDLQRAVPCGLLVNELISNAYKHAFPAGRRGRITIDLALEEDGQAVLEVSDDGVGIAPGRDALDTPTLGLQLVRMLASQINGRLAVEPSTPGTCFELRFVATDAQPVAA